MNIFRYQAIKNQISLVNLMKMISHHLKRIFNQICIHIILFCSTRLPSSFLSNKNKIEAEFVILTVAFNRSDLLALQVKALQKYAKSKFQYMIFDNSTSNVESDIIRKFCMSHGIVYVKRAILNFLSRSPSISHGAALNTAIAIIARSPLVKYLLVLDHDIYPTKSFSPESMLMDHDFAAPIQLREYNEYYWPGLAMINASKVSLKTLSFMPLRGLDTGAKLRDLLIKQGASVTSYKHNGYFCVDDGQLLTRNDRRFDSLLHDNKIVEMHGSWVHMINGSGWRGLENDQKRINYIETIIMGTSR